MKRVRVVAAVIRRDGRILVTRRHGHAERGGQWEFPGGKVEPGEGEPEALVAEIREELDCAVAVGALLARTTHRYPDLEVELAFFACALLPGERAAPRRRGRHGVGRARPASRPTTSARPTGRCCRCCWALSG